MKTEHSAGFGHVEEYGSDRWIEISSQHNSPLHEYSNFGFVAPSNIPLDSIDDRSQEPSYSAPPPLYIPQWPSQLTSPSQGPPPPPIPTVRPIAPATSTSSVQPVTTTTSRPMPASAPQAAPSNARKTLTDSDRRRMCEYHEENPNVKQTEIGGTSLPHPCFVHFD